MLIKKRYASYQSFWWRSFSAWRSLTFLERPAKMLYDAALYLTIQKTLYVGWGPPDIGGFLEPAAIFATLLLAFFLRKEKRAFRLTIGAGFALLLAFPVVFFALVAPANELFLGATTTSIPPNWMEARTNRETGHAIRFVLQLVAFSLLLISVFIDGNENSA